MRGICSDPGKELERRRKLSEIRGEKHHNFGKHPSEQTLKKLSAVHKGVPKSEDHKRKIGLANKGNRGTFLGKHHTPESIAKISASQKGKVITEEARIKNGSAHRGTKHTEEHKKKIGDALRGKPLSEETKKKLSESRKGMKFLPEHIENMRISRLGKKHTPEHCKHISDGNKGKTMSETARQKIRESRLGEKNPSFGKPWTPLMYEKCVHHLENHPRWKGGISFEPYCQKFNRDFKERVRNFFGYTCVECGSPQLKEKHHVHHVNFDKMSCCNDTPPLFVTLCRSCHGKTQSDRPYWEQHFTDLINTKYNGKCYLTKQEVN